MDIGSLVLEILNGRSIENVIAEALSSKQRANLRRRARAMKIKSGLLGDRRDRSKTLSARASKTVGDYVRASTKKLGNITGKVLADFTTAASKPMQKEFERKILRGVGTLGIAALPGVVGTGLGGAYGYMKNKHLSRGRKPPKTKKDRKLRRKLRTKRIAKGSLIGGGIGTAVGGAWLYRHLRKRQGL